MITSDSSAPAGAQLRPARKTIFHQIWRARVSYLLLLPFLVPFLIFVVFPLVWSAYLSLHEYQGVATNPPEYVGTANFSQALGLTLVELPPLLDDATGERIYECGREDALESQVAEHEAAGEVCELQYARMREVLPRGQRELTRFLLGGTTYVIGASDVRFWTGITNTLKYTVAAVFFSTVLGLLLATVLQRQSRFNMILRILFFLPAVTNAVAITVVWRYIFTGEGYGLANTFFESLGLARTTFLAEQSWSLPILIMLAVWGGMGYNMILFLAGLQSIPEHLQEAAAIDGASPAQRFWHITIPLLRPTLIYVVITGTIGALQMFEPVYLLFSDVERIGGVLDSALTIVPYLYDQGFQQFELGYASAIAWLLFIVIFIITLINMRVGRVSEAF